MGQEVSTLNIPPRKVVKTIAVGQEVEGIVKRVTEFGAFVDIGVGRDGLVHVSEMAQDRVAKASDVVKEGDKVQVWIKELDRDKNRISLSMVAPGTRTLRDLEEGMVVSGRVTRLERYGAFVDVGVGRDGMLHVKEMGRGYVEKPEDVAQGWRGDPGAGRRNRSTPRPGRPEHQRAAAPGARACSAPHTRHPKHQKKLRQQWSKRNSSRPLNWRSSKPTRVRNGDVSGARSLTCGSRKRTRKKTSSAAPSSITAKARASRHLYSLLRTYKSSNKTVWVMTTHTVIRVELWTFSVSSPEHPAYLWFSLLYLSPTARPPSPPPGCRCCSTAPPPPPQTAPG